MEPQPPTRTEAHSGTRAWTRIARHVRTWSADVLIKTAYRIDPLRPKVTSDKRTGGHLINIGTISVGRVTPEMVSDMREVGKR